jgi:hypothetical protein
MLPESPGYRLERRAPMAIGSDGLEKLKTQTVLDADGRSVLLADLWRDRRAAMVFVRHFG